MTTDLDDDFPDTVIPEPEVVVIRMDRLVGAKVRYWALRLRCEKWPCDLCEDECTRLRRVSPATDWAPLDPC